MSASVTVTGEGVVAVPSGSEMVAEALVLGAGISGMVSASVLLEQGAQSVVVVDSYERAGGNHLDAHLGAYTFDVGSLIFQDDSPLLAHFPELLPLYVPIEPSWARLNPQGRVAAYPFSVADDIVPAGPVEALLLVSSAVRARLRRGEQHSAQDFAEHWLGPRFLRRSGLESYMERFCGVPIAEIDLEFANSRMMWIPGNASARHLAHQGLNAARRLVQRAVSGRPRPGPAPQNQQLARPRSGYADLYRPALASLEARGARVVLGVRFDRLRREGPGFVLDTSDGPVRAERVVSTLPVDVALDLCDVPRSGPRLPTVLLTSLYFSFSGTRNFSSSVLYNFSHEGSWKRLTVYSDFYGLAQGREYLTVEVVAVGGAQPAEEAAEAFRAHTAANGLLDGDLRLEGTHRLEHAYPIYTHGSGGRARAAVRALQDFGVVSLGRQGAFRYQPTARQSTIEVEERLRSPT